MVHVPQQDGAGGDGDGGRGHGHHEQQPEQHADACRDATASEGGGVEEGVEDGGAVEAVGAVGPVPSAGSVGPVDASGPVVAVGLSSTAGGTRGASGSSVRAWLVAAVPSGMATTAASVAMRGVKDMRSASRASGGEDEGPMRIPSSSPSA